MLPLYSWLMELVVRGILLPCQLLQVICGCLSWQAVCERMAWVEDPKPSGRPRAIIHAVSIGEVAAAEPIIVELVSQLPSLEIILTIGHRDALSTVKNLLRRNPQISAVLFLPWDRKGAMRRWLSILQPTLLVTVETEIWPNLFTECRRQSIPVSIVNGRIYPRDLKRYRFVFGLMRQTLACAHWIGVQNEQERQRFLQIGAPPEVTQVVGNSKYDLTLVNNQNIKIPLARLANIGDLMVAGSTHAPEERWILEAFKQLHFVFPTLRLVLAPRKVGRVPAIERLANTKELQVVRWSNLTLHNGPWDVLLVDELGYLCSLYKVARVVLIGGSLVNRGGHNPLEAALYGRVIITGPNMQHFQTITEDFHRHRALTWLNQREELLPALRDVLSDPAGCQEQGVRALARLRSKQGSAKRYATTLAHIVCNGWPPR